MQSLDEKRIQEIVEKVMARLGGADLPATPLEAIDRAHRQDGAAATRAGLRTAAARRDQAQEHPHPDGAARHLPRRRLGGEGGAQGVRAVRARADRDAQQDDRGDARRRRWRTCASSPSTPSPRPGSGASRTSSRRTRSSRQDAGHRDPAADRLLGRLRPDDHRARALRRVRRDHADDQPDRDDHLQRHRHGRRRQRGRLQHAPVGVARVRLAACTCSTRRSSARAGRRTCCARSPSRPSRARRR